MPAISGNGSDAGCSTSQKSPSRFSTARQPRENIRLHAARSAALQDASKRTQARAGSGQAARAAGMAPQKPATQKKTIFSIERIPRRMAPQKKRENQSQPK
mgnify:CR=1 FL=1